VATTAEIDSGNRLRFSASVSKKIGIPQAPIISRRVVVVMRKLRILNASLLVAIAAVAIAIVTQIW
jgi:hypothetical protein